MDPAGSETLACQYDLYAGTGRSPLTICQCRRWPAPGRRGVIAGDVRRGEVGLAHSSGEAGEQPERSGVSGAKERGQGNAEQPHAPDTEPESMSQRLSRVREAAKQRKKERFTALFHLLTVEALEAAFLS